MTISAWILNTLIEPEVPRNDVGVLDGLTFLDNEEKYLFDKNLLENKGVLPGDVDKYFQLLLDFENKSKPEHLRIINEHLKHVLNDFCFSDVVIQLKGLRFVNDVDEDNREARFKGKFKHLSGRIFKDYKDFYYPNGHLVKRFKIYFDWPVVCEIDFHKSEKMVMGFYAFDKMNRMYVIREVFDRLSANDMAYIIVNYKKAENLRMNRVFIDPLAKGDEKELKNRFGNLESTFTLLKRALNPHGILLDSARKDKWGANARIREMLLPKEQIPGLFVFDDCRLHRTQFKQWSYTKTGEWSDEDDHFMEAMGRAAICGVKYTLVDDNKKYVFKPEKGIV